MTAQKHKNEDNSMKTDSHETRIALLEQSIGHIGQTLLRLEKKMDEGFNEIKSDMKTIKNELNLRIDKLDSRLWQIMFLISSSIVGAILGKIFHWF